MKLMSPESYTFIHNFETLTLQSSNWFEFGYIFQIWAEIESNRTCLSIIGIYSVLVLHNNIKIHIVI